MKLRGYVYYIFPCDFDTETGSSELKEGIIWFCFSWLFWLTRLVISLLVEEPVFPVKVPKREMQKLTQKERDDLNL